MLQGTLGFEPNLKRSSNPHMTVKKPKQKTWQRFDTKRTLSKQSEKV